MLSGLTLRGKVQQALDALAADTSGTVLLGAIEDGELVHVDRRDSRAPLRVASSAGQVRPINHGILGKLLLAHMLEEYVHEALRAHPFVKRARRAITSEEECMAELARIREVGYATAIDETTDGVAGVAAPIMGVDAKVIAGPAVLMPTAAWADDVRAQDLDAVCAAAEQVSKLMGYQAGLIHESLLEEPHCLGKRAQLETQETQEGHEQCNAQRGPESCAGSRLSRTPSPTQPGLLR